MMLPPPRPDHDGNDMMGQKVGALEHDVKGQVPFLFLEIENVLADGDAGVVAQDIDPAEFAGGLIGRSPAIGVRTNVAPDETGLAPPAMISPATSRPFFSSISRRTTAAPNSASLSAIPRPIPEAAPVTRAVFPSSEMSPKAFRAESVVILFPLRRPDIRAFS